MGVEESKQLNEENYNKIIQSINDIYKKEDNDKSKPKIINEKNKNSYKITNSNLNNYLNNENIIHLFQNILPNLYINSLNKFNNNAIYYNLMCNNLFDLENLSKEMKNDFLIYSQNEFNNYTNELLSIEEKNKNLGNKEINRPSSFLDINNKEIEHFNKNEKEIIYIPKDNINEIITDCSPKKKDYLNNMSIHGKISKIYKLNFEDEKIYNEIINYDKGLEIEINDEENDLSINETSKITLREESFYSKDESIHEDIDKILSSKKPKISTQIIYKKKKINGNKFDDIKIKRIKSNEDKLNIEQMNRKSNDKCLKICKSNEYNSKISKNSFKNNNLINEKNNKEINKKTNHKNVKDNHNDDKRFSGKEYMENSFEQYKKIISPKKENLINNKNEEEKNEEINISKYNLRQDSNNNNIYNTNKKFKNRDIIMEKGNKDLINNNSINEKDKNKNNHNIIIEKDKNIKSRNIKIEKDKNKNNHNKMIEKEKNINNKNIIKEKNKNNIIIEKEKNIKNQNIIKEKNKNNIIIEKEKNQNNLIEKDKNQYMNKESNKKNPNYIIENKNREKNNKDIINEQNSKNYENKELEIDNKIRKYNLIFEKENQNNKNIQINYNLIPNKRLLLKEKIENEKKKNNHDLIHQMGNRFLSIKLSSSKYPKIEKEYNIDLSKYNNKITFLNDNKNNSKKEINNPYKNNIQNYSYLQKYKMNNIVEKKTNDIINENENNDETINSDYKNNLIYSNSNPNFNKRIKNDLDSFKIDLQEILKEVENDNSKKQSKKENKNINNINKINDNNNYLYKGLSFIEAIDKFLELDKGYSQKKKINKKKGNEVKKISKSIIKTHNSENLDYFNLKNCKTISKLNQSKRYTNKESSISNSINYGNPNYSLTISKEDENILSQKNTINYFNLSNKKVNNTINQETTRNYNLFLKQNNSSNFNLLSKSQNVTTNYNLLNQQIITEKSFKNNSLIDSQINVY